MDSETFMKIYKGKIKMPVRAVCLGKQCEIMDIDRSYNLIVRYKDGSIVHIEREYVNLFK